MIEVYASRLHPGKETYETSAPQTVLAWLHANGISKEARLAALPMSLYLNGERLLPSAWGRIEFTPTDHVEIYREPKGTDPFSITFALIFGAAAVLKALTPKIPTTNSSSQTQGDPLNEANAKGNTVKLNDIIPELAGFNPERFPDYAAPPRRYFAGPFEQRIEMNLVVGRGRYDIPLNKVKVGATPMLALGDDARFQIYEPGADMSADPAHLCWYTAPEVGASSNGSAGLELTATTDLTPSADASAYQFAGTAISVPSGAGEFPADWEVGIVLRVIAPYTYTVVDGGAGRDIVRGPLAMLNPYVGMPIEVNGANAGNYIVNSYKPYQPAVPATPGTRSTLTGSAAPTRYDFNVTPLTFTINRGSTYSVTLNTATTNLAGLITELNTRLSATPIRAEQASGRVRFYDQSPYTGQAITATGATTILGSAPVGVAGTAATSGTPEQPAEMTLNYDGGSPVTGLALGEGLATIGARGFKYQITAFSTTLMQVDRLGPDGQVDDDWPGFDSMQTVNGSISLDSSNLQAGYRGPFPACPEGELITAIEFDVLYPSGLIFLGKKGQRWEMIGTTQFEYRDMNGPGSWVAAEFTQSAATLDAAGYTHTINLPYPMRPECRHKKILVDMGGDRETEYFDKVMWLNLKGLMINSSKTRYEGVTMMTCDIRGGDRISSQTENKVSVECKRILPVLRNGVWQPEQPTREISAWVGHVARDVGYSDTEDLDIAELERLESTYWTPRGEVYDKIIDSADTVKGSMIEALNAGMSELTIDRGVLVPVRDDVRGDVFDHVYNPQVMTDDLEISFNGPELPDQYDGVDVEYYSHKTRQNEVRPCRLPTDAGTRVLKLKLEGVTDELRVWRWGMRERRKQIYRQRTFSFATEMDALNSAYGDYTALGVSIPGYGQSAEIESFAVLPDGRRLIGSTEPLDWSIPGTYKVLVRRRDGTASGPYIATQVSEYQLTIPDLDFTPDLSGAFEPPIIQFGHESRWCHPALITSVKPRGTKACAVEADIYDVRVYADDNNFPPL